MPTPHAPLAHLRACFWLFLACAVVGGCGGRVYDPAMATRSYPQALSQGDTIQAEAYRDGERLVIVNATPRAYADFDVWINQRYMHHVEELAAGETLHLDITGFFDAWGETPVPGGFFRTEAPTPIVLVQFQLDRTQPLLGLVTVPVNDEF